MLCPLSHRGDECRSLPENSKGNQEEVTLLTLYLRSFTVERDVLHFGCRRSDLSIPPAHEAGQSWPLCLHLWKTPGQKWPGIINTFHEDFGREWRSRYELLRQERSQQDDALRTWIKSVLCIPAFIGICIFVLVWVLSLSTGLFLLLAVVFSLTLHNEQTSRTRPSHKPVFYKEFGGYGGFSAQSHLTCLGGPRPPPFGPFLCTCFRNQKITKSENQNLPTQEWFLCRHIPAQITEMESVQNSSFEGHEVIWIFVTRHIPQLIFPWAGCDGVEPLCPQSLGGVNNKAKGLNKHFCTYDSPERLSPNFVEFSILSQTWCDIFFNYDWREDGHVGYTTVYFAALKH